MSKLEGKTIAVTGARRFEELRKIIESLGGTALSRPAQATIYLDDTELKASLKSLMEGPSIDWFIFTTGSGLETMIAAAGEMGLQETFTALLRNTRIAARGYKTVNVLKKLGITAAVRDDDGTTDGLIRSFSTEDLEGVKVAVQLHGEPMPKLSQWLQKQGAEPIELLPYRHIPPEEHTLQMLVSEIIGSQIDAVAFTTASQVRSLFEWAMNKGVMDQVVDALNHQVVAAAVGKVTEDALTEAGIGRIVVPKEERMGSMIIELAKYLSAK